MSAVADSCCVGDSVALRGIEAVPKVDVGLFDWDLESDALRLSCCVSESDWVKESSGVKVGLGLETDVVTESETDTEACCVNEPLCDVDRVAVLSLDGVCVSVSVGEFVKEISSVADWVKESVIVFVP